MLLLIITSCLVLAGLDRAAALENGLARTPPMGWISWERFVCVTDCQQYPEECISSRLYKEMADRLDNEGYAKLGYQYVNIDDCWSEMERDPTTGDLVEDRARFPEGIDGLAKYIHSKNLKLGIYGDCGTKTCAGYPAQLKSEQDLEDNYFDLDARRFASWQVDSFKFDGCHLDAAKAESICPKMSSAIKAAKRPTIVVCEWPFYMLRQIDQLMPNFTLAQEACNAWRYYEDVEDSWLSIQNIVDFTLSIQLTILKHHGPGHWFDPDQLIIGNFGLSLDQARAQMALWAVWSAPLYMSNDLRRMAPEMAQILKNEQLIAVDQDRMGVFGLMVAEKRDPNHVQAFVKPVEPIRGGCPSFVVVYLNRNTLGTRRLVDFKLRDLLLRVPYALAAQRHRDLFKPNDIASTSYSMSSVVQAEEFVADKCKRFIQLAMTKDPRDSALLNKPLLIDASQAKVSLEEQQVDFRVIDLFGDEMAYSQVPLDGDLELMVNPSGVRAVKLIQV